MEKNIRKMKKRELLEVLLEQEREIEKLKEENVKLKKNLESKKIKINNSGSIAEAAIEISEIFEAAQKAADLYVRNVRAKARKDYEEK